MVSTLQRRSTFSSHLRGKQTLSATMVSHADSVRQGLTIGGRDVGLGEAVLGLAILAAIIVVDAVVTYAILDAIFGAVGLSDTLSVHR